MQRPYETNALQVGMAVRSLLAANSELAAGLAALGYRCSERSAIGGGSGQVLVPPFPGGSQLRRQA